MNASEIISKKVFSIEEGCEVGYVLNFSLDKQLSKLDFLTIVSLYEENEFVLKTEDISSISNEAVFIRSSSLLNFDTNIEEVNPIGKKIFTVKGEFLGKAIDVEIYRGKVKKIIGSTCEILPKHIYSSGRDCIFFSKTKLKKEKERNNESRVKVEIQKVALPFKEKRQGTDIVGKTIFRDVLDENHFVVFRKNQVVTPKLLIEARRKGLLKKVVENSI